MAILHDVVVGCRHPASLARFWAAAIDGYRVAAYDDAELERLRTNGITDPEDDPSVLVESDPGVRPRLWFQLVRWGLSGGDPRELVAARPARSFPGRRRPIAVTERDEPYAACPVAPKWRG